MEPFALTAPARTLFGRDCRHRTAELAGPLGRRMVLVRGRSVPWVDDLRAELQASGIALEVIHSSGEPTLDQVRDARRQARAFGADCILAVGGGATIDLGKALAGLCPSSGDPADYMGLGGQPAQVLEPPLPFAAVPTTAGTGAEATRNAVLGVPERGLKVSLRDTRLLPTLAIVDPALTDDAPMALTLASGLDAITQLAESYLCNRANPVTDALCRDTLPDAIRALKRLTQGECPAARDTMARASYLSGLALANSGLGIVHGLASVIGGRGGAHGAICGRLLADALAVNREAMQDRGRDSGRISDVAGWLAEGLGAEGTDGIDALRSFLAKQDFPSLSDLGAPSAAFETIAEATMAASSTKANPVELTKVEILGILQGAEG
ncbi:MAG: alcohol dehydrogenase [Rhodobacteraceae bacterium]|nr:alcohol dehydrogenase [Paracoccaceae bacterium]